ncbi:tetratricopeptide repeat protein [Magnetovibrio sp. PR-2]|uniref:tetratricopeptide repeat protein n=1 Tax=Magnetovibrio sp. PR-2 TaxID=3120356 RepID=UPI002FCE0DCA
MPDWQWLTTLIDWFVTHQDDILKPVATAIILGGAAWFFGVPKRILSFMRPAADELPPSPLSQDAQLAKELGVTEAALRNFFKILEEDHVGPDELDAKLREIAGRHKDLLTRVAAIPDVDERTTALRQDAEAAIADGRYDDADAILHDAENQDLQAVAELEDQLHARHMAAYESAVARAELAKTRIKYLDAAHHYKRAADHCPDKCIEEQIGALASAGGSYYLAADYSQGENVLTAAQELADQHLSSDAPLTAIVLNNLALHYKATNRLDKAEPLMERALKIHENAFGPDHPKVAIRLNNLAQLYHATHRLEKAEPLMERALNIDENAFGPNHPKVATRLNNLASLYYDTHRLDKAEPLMERAHGILLAAYGAEHPKTQGVANNLDILRREIAACSDRAD